MNPSPEVAEFETRYMDWSTKGSPRPEQLVKQVSEASTPAEALDAIGLLYRWLDHQEQEAVETARVAGLSWSQIGTLLGRTKQAVWDRYRDE